MIRFSRKRFSLMLGSILHRHSLKMSSPSGCLEKREKEWKVLLLSVFETAPSLEVEKSARFSRRRLKREEAGGVTCSSVGCCSGSCWSSQAVAKTQNSPFFHTNGPACWAGESHSLVPTLSPNKVLPLWGCELSCRVQVSCRVSLRGDGPWVEGMVGGNADISGSWQDLWRPLVTSTTGSSASFSSGLALWAGETQVSPADRGRQEN